MLTVLFYIIIGCAAIALAIALVVIAVKILLVVIPIALVVGVVVLCVKGCDNSWDLEHWFNDKTQKVLNDSPVRKYRNVEEKDLHEEIASITRQKAGVSISSLRPELERAILESAIPAYREAIRQNIIRHRLIMPVLLWISGQKTSAVCQNAKPFMHKSSRKSEAAFLLILKMSARKMSTCMCRCEMERSIETKSIGSG